mgnify:CR=1 FL=1
MSFSAFSLMKLISTLPLVWRKASCALLILSAATAPVSVHAQQPGAIDGEAEPWFRNQADTAKYFFIITGAAASEEIRDRFRRWSFSLYDTLGSDYGYQADQLILLIDEGNVDARDAARVDGSSRREDIEGHVQNLQARVNQGDQVSFFLIGHGSSSGPEAKFNIAGPDITGAEFAGLLNGFEQQDVVVINTTSASYDFSAELSARGRVVISATRSRAERFDPVFPEYLLEALAGRKGDRDKNNRVSILEAFTYARLSVDNWYKQEGRLATEHAVLDDNGDGMFSMEPAPEIADGRLAEIAYVDLLSSRTQKQSPQAQQRLAEIQDLERSVFILRGQQSNYLEDDYWKRLEVLLIDLARKTGIYNELP